MRRTLAIAAAIMMGVGGCMTATAADTSKPQTTGELVDMYCYTAAGAHGADHKDCGVKCAKSGIPVGVLVDGKAVTIAANPIPLADYVSQTVRVTGDNKDGILVPDKIEVKDGDNWKEIKLSDAHHE
jgi:hypothetical protein